jgi:predicted MFS family arabinose efflux permease
MTSLDRRFWRLYASSATSNLADGIGRTALPLLAASYTRSPVLIAGLVTFAFLPWLFFALPSGALVDRLDRRYAMAGANAMRALSTGTLAVLVLTGAAGIVIVYAVAFALGIAETVYDSASRAILPQVVDSRDLDRANSLLTVEETLGQTFLGAPVGSALFVLAASLPLMLNAGGFAIAAALVLTLRGSFRPKRPERPTSVRADIADGVRWLTRHRFLRGLTAISAATALCQTMATSLFVLYVLDVARLPAGDFGVVLLIAGIGGLIGGLATPPLTRRYGRGAMLVSGAVLSAVATGAMGLTRNGILGAALFAASAAGVMVWNVLTMSLRQALIPQHLFGRVQGAYRTLVWGAMPVGALLGGLLASAVGVRVVFAVSGVGLLACAAWLADLVRRHRAALVDGPAVPAHQPVPAAV